VCFELFEPLCIVEQHHELAIKKQAERMLGICWQAAAFQNDGPQVGSVQLAQPILRIVDVVIQWHDCTGRRIFHDLFASCHHNVWRRAGGDGSKHLSVRRAMELYTQPYTVRIVLFKVTCEVQQGGLFLTCQRVPQMNLATCGVERFDAQRRG